MLKSILSIAFLSLSITVISQNKNINFEHTTFAEIKAKAKKGKQTYFCGRLYYLVWAMQANVKKCIYK